MSGQNYEEWYKYEKNRLDTFQQWPANAKVEAWKLAKAGLLYTGQDEEVRCFACSCVLSHWQYGDQVMTRHRLASPECPFVRNESDNVPFLAPTSASLPSLPPSSLRSPPSPEAPTSHSLSSPDQLSTDDAGISPHTRQRPPLVALSPRSVSVRHSPEGPTSLDYNSEATRLSSFTNWRVPFISPESLAKAGFYALDPSGREDACRCAFCNNCVGDWVEGDDPFTEHRNLFPLCRFVQGHEVGNIPLLAPPGEVPQQGEEPRQQQQGQVAGNAGNRSIWGADETGSRWSVPHLESGSGSEKGNCSLVGREDCGVLSHAGPIHPQHATQEARLRTFRDWPPALQQKPLQLAEAGFYYIGLSDQVKCFYCDGGLRNWQAEDIPWVEHARWFSKCVFVRLVKGDKFIDQCLSERPPEKVSIPNQQQQRCVSEDELRSAMSEAIVKQVLSMGIDHARVKMALKQQLEANGGKPFSSAESLIAAAFSVQRSQERRNLEENLNPVGARRGGTWRRT